MTWIKIILIVIVTYLAIGVLLSTFLRALLSVTPVRKFLRRHVRGFIVLWEASKFILLGIIIFYSRSISIVTDASLYFIVRLLKQLSIT